MALEVEGVVDGGVYAEKTLGGANRLEPLHLALSPPHRLMRVFGSIVLPHPLLMRAGQSQTPERAGVGAQLVGDQQRWSEALLLEQLAAPPECRADAEPACRGPRLRGRRHATDPSAHRRSAPHFVEVPAIARPRTAPA